MKSKLYLIPTTLGESPLEKVLPSYVMDILNEIKIFIVENVRTARRFLVKAKIKTPIDALQFHVLDKHTSEFELSNFLKEIENQNIGLMSEAGCPAVADPGALIVKMAHQKQIQVVPLVGPSSILLSLMASGLNGQNFAFIGYIPIKKPDRIKTIQQLEKRSQIEKQTQIFIETPYRNKQLLDDILQTCQNKTQVCIACNITLDDEYIETKSVQEWKKKQPEIDKKTAIFLIAG